MPKHFLHLTDYSNSQIWELLHIAKDLKAKFHNTDIFKR